MPITANKTCVFDEHNSNIEQIEDILNKESDQAQLKHLNIILFKQLVNTSHPLAKTPLNPAQNAQTSYQSASHLPVARYRKNAPTKHVQLRSIQRGSNLYRLYNKPSFRATKSAFHCRKIHYTVKRQYDTQAFKQRLVDEQKQQLLVKELKKKVEF